MKNNIQIAMSLEQGMATANKYGLVREFMYLINHDNCAVEEALCKLDIL